MPPVPLLRARDVVRAFERLGGKTERQRGSHIILTKPGHAATLSIPDHSDHARVARGTLRALINKAGLSLQDFIAALER
jgi:predicted RNA binding protein YcfA (HicA-like mRNA interferase family)